MSNERIFVGLGSNCAKAREMLDRAVQNIALLSGITLQAVSPIYETEPQDYRQQDWFQNCVIELSADTSWQEMRLLDALLEIETQLGRIRTKDSPRYGPRVIDLDLLLFGTRCSTQQRCLLPHPRMLQRAFVLVPLSDLAPLLCLGEIPIRDWLKKLTYYKIGSKIFQ